MRCQKHDERSYGQDAHRDGPAAVHLAEDPVGGYDDVVEEHLGELAHAVDHLDRRDGDPGRVHVDEERGDAAVARLRRAGSRQQHAAIRVLRQARPHLLAVDRPTIDAVAGSPSGSGPAAQRREVASGARLREPLAPHLGAREQAGHDLGGERGRREVDERRREHLDEREEARVGEVACRPSAAPSSVRSIGDPPRPPTRSGQP